MSDEKQISWIYEGPKSSVNCEDYLLGKKIDKNFELYSDVVKKEEDKIDEIVKKKSSTEPGRVNSLKVESIVGEDPLVAIRLKQAKKEKAALENPVFKKKIEDYLRKKFEVVYKAQLKLEKIAKNLNSKSSESSDSLSSDFEEERKNLRSNNTSSKHTYNKDYSRTKSRRKRERDQSADSDTSIKRTKKHYDKTTLNKDNYSSNRKHKHYNDRYSDSSVERKKDYDDEKISSKNDSSYDKKRYSSHKDTRRSQKPSHSDKLKERKNDVNDRRRDHKNSYSRDKKIEKKPKMTPEEMEEKRREMIENAKWREESRKKILDKASTYEIKEEIIEKETRSNEVFKPKLL